MKGWYTVFLTIIFLSVAGCLNLNEHSSNKIDIYIHNLEEYEIIVNVEIFILGNENDINFLVVNESIIYPDEYTNPNSYKIKNSINESKIKVTIFNQSTPDRLIISEEILWVGDYESLHIDFYYRLRDGNRSYDQPVVEIRPDGVFIN